MTDNLPVSAEPKTGSGATSLSRMISTASVAEVDRLLHAGPVTARKLAERLAVMRHIYYATDATDAERQALLVIWTEALGSIPAPFVLAAFGEWFANGTHKPAPGHIRARALELRNHALTRRENLAGPALPREGEADMAPLSEEALARRKQLAAEMAGRFPHLIKRILTSEADL